MVSRYPFTSQYPSFNSFWSGICVEFLRPEGRRNICSWLLLDDWIVKPWVDRIFQMKWKVKKSATLSPIFFLNTLYKRSPIWGIWFLNKGASFWILADDFPKCGGQVTIHGCNKRSTIFRILAPDFSVNLHHLPCFFFKLFISVFCMPFYRLCPIKVSSMETSNIWRIFFFTILLVLATFIWCKCQLKGQSSKIRNQISKSKKPGLPKLRCFPP